MVLFWILWSTFVFLVFKDDEQLKLADASASNLIELTLKTYQNKEV
jgi:hypothetical protein